MGLREAVHQVDGLHRLALLALGQGGGDLGQRIGRGAAQGRIAARLHLGQPQHQRLDLQLGEGLRRQRQILGHGIAEARLALDPGAGGAQRVDIAVDRAL